MDKILAYRMSPMHLSPPGSIGIMLKESMVFAVEVNKTVRVVHPAFAILEMIEHLSHPVYNIMC